MAEDQPIPPPARGYDLSTFGLAVSFGLITTAVALAGVWYAERRYHEYVMSFYFYYFLPVGAAIVGLVAGSGYLIAGKTFGLQFGKVKLTILFALQVLAYFAAQYIEFNAQHLVYRETLQPVGFWEYFHATAMSYRFTLEHGQTLRLEYFGYVLRALEIAIFAGGALLLAATLERQPFCQTCRQYRKNKPLATIFASHFVTLDDAATQRENEQAIIDGAQAAYDALATIAQVGSADTFNEQLREHPPIKRTSELPSGLSVELIYCPTCMEAWLTGSAVIKRPHTSSIRVLDGKPVPPDFARELTQRASDERSEGRASASGRR